MCMVRFMKILAIASGTACALLLGATVGANASPYVVTLEQVGTSVVATGSGDINTAGLTFDTSTSDEPEMSPNGAALFIGGVALESQLVDLNTVTFTAGDPTNFGSGILTVANSTTGTFVGIGGSVGQIDLATNYTSGTSISDSATFDSETFATLGVTPGTYEWTWGDASDQSYTLIIGTAATPLPAALPLFASGLGAMGLLGWRRKRKAAAIAA